MVQFLKKQKKTYDKMMNPEQPDNTKPAQPTDTKKIANLQIKLKQQIKKQLTVKTGDETNVVIFVSLSMVSGWIILSIKKRI